MHIGAALAQRATVLPAELHLERRCFAPIVSDISLMSFAQLKLKNAGAIRKRSLQPAATSRPARPAMFNMHRKAARLSSVGSAVLGAA